MFLLKGNKISFLGQQVLLTGLWNLKDIKNLRQNHSKNKLAHENAVARVHGSCSRRVMGSCLKYHYPREVASEDEDLKYLEPDFVVLENVFPY